MSITDYINRDIRLRHLRLLVAIDDAGRLTRAARLLHVTQPALSKALAEIERSVGMPLFERTPRGLSPTAAGTTLIRAARAALGEIERAGDELRQPSDVAMRVLNVGMMPTSGWTLGADAIARLQALRPSTTVRVIDGPTGMLLQQLVAGRLDLILGARVRATFPEGVESVPLYDDAMRLIVAPGHPLARQRAPDWTRAIAAPWVLMPTGHPTRTAFDRALRRLGWPAPPVVVEALSADVVVALVDSLGAVALTSGRLAARLEARGAVRSVAPALADALAIPLQVTAFAAPSYEADPDVAALVRCLREVSTAPRPRRESTVRRSTGPRQAGGR